MSETVNHIKVLFFATLRDRAGTKLMEFDLPNSATVQDLKECLAKKYPSLAEAMESVLVAVNHEYAFENLVIPDGAEVAMFPPVSGG